MASDPEDNGDPSAETAVETEANTEKHVQLCEHCGKDISKLKRPNSHRWRYKKVQHMCGEARVQDPFLGGLDTAEDSVTRNDTTTTAEQIFSKSRVLHSFSDIIQSLSKAGLSPRIAAASLEDLLRYPKVHNIVAHLEEKQSPNEFAIYWRAEDFAAPADAQDIPRRFSYQITPLYMTSENAKLLIQHGLVPILERFVVPPDQLPKNQNWLLNAAKILATASDHSFTLVYAEQNIEFDGDTAFARLRIRGINPTSPIRLRRDGFLKSRTLWYLSMRIYGDLPASAADLTIPNEDRIAWRRRRGQQNDGTTAFKFTPGWKLALLLTATFNEFLGSQADAKSRIHIMALKLATPTSTTARLVDSDGSESPETIRNLMPW